MLQDQTAEEEVKKSDIKTGKWLNFEILVKYYDNTYDDKNGIYFVVNEEFGIDALTLGSLISSGIDASKFASHWLLMTKTVLVLLALTFNIY